MPRLRIRVALLVLAGMLAGSLHAQGTSADSEAAVALKPAPPARPVTIAAADGFTLAARYYAAAGPGPGVLLLHQCNRMGDSTGYEGLGPRLARAGIHALALDFRGFARSTDARYRSFRSRMADIEPHFPDDVDRTAAFLAAQPGVRGGRLAVVGASCGGWQALLLAGRRAGVRAVVLLSGAFDEEKAEAALLRIAEQPLLVVFSEDDGFGTPASSRSAFAASRHPASRLLLYKGRGHGTPLFAQDSGLEDLVVRWLRERLEPAT